MLQKTFDALVAFGPLGILLLSFIDSAGIPLAGGPDAAIVLLAIHAPSLAYWGASAAIIGSMGGNLFLFLAARRGGIRFLERSEQPGSRSMRFRHWFRRYGLMTVFVPALVPFPLPLKIFVISAGALGIGLRPFLLVILLGRIPRFLGEAYLGVKLGEESVGYLKDNAGILAGLAAGLLVFIYLLLLISERIRRPAQS